MSSSLPLCATLHILPHTVRSLRNFNFILSLHVSMFYAEFNLHSFLDNQCVLIPSIDSFTITAEKLHSLRFCKCCHSFE